MPQIYVKLSDVTHFQKYFINFKKYQKFKKIFNKVITKINKIEFCHLWTQNKNSLTKTEKLVIKIQPVSHRRYLRVIPPSLDCLECILWYS